MEARDGARVDLESPVTKTGVPLSAAHPTLLIDHVIERCRSHAIEPRLDLELIHEAVEDLLVEGEAPPIERRSRHGSPEAVPDGLPPFAGRPERKAHA
jgi:hypothetical protein